jgi:hypothetical protein
MKIPKDLIAAINTYYAFKYIHGGIFSSSEIKYAVCKNVTDCAVKHNVDCLITPGTIFLHKGKQKLQINKPIVPEG